MALQIHIYKLIRSAVHSLILKNVLYNSNIKFNLMIKKKNYVGSFALQRCVDVNTFAKLQSYKNKT